MENISELENLKKELKEIEDVQASLQSLKDKGIKLSYSQKRQYDDNQKRIETLKESIVKEMAKDLITKIESLANNASLTDEEKDKLQKAIQANFKKLQQDFSMRVKEVLSIKNMSQLKACESKLLDDKKALINALAVLKNDDEAANKYTIEKYEEQLKTVNEKLNLIVVYQKINIDKAELKQDLDDLKTGTKGKDAIVKKYKTIIEAFQKALISEPSLGEPINSNDTKDATKDKLAVVSDFFKKHKKKIIAIGSTAALLAGLIAVLKGCSKNIENNNDLTSDMESSNGFETSEENLDKERINALTNKGYDEFTAITMVKNFDDKTIEALINGPYIGLVTKYASVPTFNLDYVIDYETALNTFGLAPEKAVDYVNRAYEINKTNFYEGATINEIVEVVMAIDKKDIYKSANAALDNSINNTISYAVIDFNQNKGTDEMIAKVGALPHFAKEDSDLETFLKEYSTILQSIIKNANNETELHAAQERMYTYLYAFANAHNGYVEESSDIVVNENAIVKDTFDWYLAYESFVRPAWTLFMPDIEKNPEYTELYNNLICLQETMLGIAKQEPYVEYCHEESLTLGGE